MGNQSPSNIDTPSPLSLAFSATSNISGYHLIETSHSSDHWGDSSDDDVDDENYENESYWKQKHKEFNITKAYNVRPSILSISSTNSNISDICLEFPYISKIEERNFDLSQKSHNSKIQNVDISQTIQVGMDLFHDYHVVAWKAKQKTMKKANNKNKKKKNKKKTKKKSKTKRSSIKIE